MGLVPRHFGAGGKNTILGISKRGDSYLRTLLIQGALSITLRAKAKKDRTSKWIADLLGRKPHNKVTVAVANKNARTILCILKDGGVYKAAM